MIKNISISNYNKHLTSDDRIQIQKIITENRTKDGSFRFKLKDIGIILNKNYSTISKEVKRHRILQINNSINVKNVNSKCICFNDCKKQVKNTINCANICADYKERVCKNLSSFPWVCNGCTKRSYCNLNKYFYYSEIADKDYKQVLKESREGIDLSKDQFKYINHVVSNGIIKGQPIAHILYSNNDLDVSIRSIYNYVENGYLDVKNIDLRRKVVYKPRYKKKVGSKLLKKNKIGRTYEDYLIYISENTDASVVQMDTVEGIKSGKLLLTLHFVKYQFQLAYLINNKQTKSISSIFEYLTKTLGVDDFKNLFEVILTDNGPEFSDPESIEVVNDTGEVRTRIFYCHPYSSYEKAECEKNHEYIRYVLPKSSSFDDLTQEKIYLLMSNINSTIRPKTKATPYQLMELAFGKEIMPCFNIKSIISTEVNLTKELVK